MAQRMTTEPDRHEGGAPVPAFPEIKSREEAARLAKSLRKDGKSHSEIAESLTVRGWKSRKGGPATPGGVDSLLKYDPKRRSRSSEEPREEVRRKGASAGPALVAGEAEEDRVDVPGERAVLLDLVLGLLEDSSVPHAARVSAALRILPLVPR